MNFEESKKKYDNLFYSDEEKAKAFDKIAEKYYFMNFGQTSKSDFDVLMFSLYIEQILKQSESDFSSYSDYNLSKLLGITQTRISNLKVRKQLQYPYTEFNWRESFKRIAGNAICEDGKIKLYIPDKNLYLELKNAIEENGGFVEVQLTTNLLQVRVEFFLDFVLMVDETQTREKARKEIKSIIEKHSEDISILEQQPIGKVLMGLAPELMIELFSQCIPFFGQTAGIIANNLYSIIKNGIKKA